METNKVLPWVLIGALILGGVYVMKSSSTPQPQPGPNPFNPWTPAPVNPNNPNPYCPVCPNCPRCDRCQVIEETFKGERAAIRREIWRTQANIQQLQTRSGVQPMKMADWLYYQDSPLGGSTVIGSKDEKPAATAEPSPPPGIEVPLK